ncbi:hypothetical protein K788_0006619 [Paraburkholderia caribensis MBA4]|uniref:Uncharacterized protein n=1 Tax=Paraburkholderia caribensis MBA4 TaxID=1323664 RepID=A0A0P0R8R2_9BURK|nr:hypothetical protein K788_0006619 [Paraburkholderia caribensis MBA4]
MDAVSTAPWCAPGTIRRHCANRVECRAAKVAVNAAQEVRSAIGQMRIIADFPSCYYRSMCHNRSAFL